MAIALDSSPAGSFVNPGTSHTQSHTCSGSDRALVVGVVANTADTVTGATYSGVSMTLVDKGTSSGRWNYLFYLSAPATGANNIVVSSSESTFIEVNSASYTGVSQSGQPEVFGKNTTAGAATSKSLSLTTVTDNAWMVMSGAGQSGSLAAGSSTTLRGTGLIGAMLDSGGAVTPAGSRTLTVTQGSSSDMSCVGAVLAPSAGGGSSFKAAWIPRQPSFIGSR